MTTAALVLGVSGCAVHASAAEHEAAHHASQAAIVMDNSPNQETALAAAKTVTGTRGDTTIEAMLASGDRLHGTVVLRIKVTIAGQGFGQSASATTACYRYQLHADVSGPHKQTCPTGNPIASATTSGPSLPGNARQLARQALAGLNAPTGLTAAAAQNAVSRALLSQGLSVHAVVVRATIGVSVLASDGRCLFARRLPRQAVSAAPAVESWIVPLPVAPTSQFTCLPGLAAQGAYKNRPPTPDT